MLCTYKPFFVEIFTRSYFGKGTSNQRRGVTLVFDRGALNRKIFQQFIQILSNRATHIKLSLQNCPFRLFP